MHCIMIVNPFLKQPAGGATAASKGSRKRILVEARIGSFLCSVQGKHGFSPNGFSQFVIV